MNDLPKSHPRYLSLKYRHALEDGLDLGIVAKTGLIAHGRGEALDYLIGEETPEIAKIACKAAAAKLILAKKPVLSVNGNVTMLCPKEYVELARAIACKIEVNLFYRTPKREKLIYDEFKKFGEEILGADEKYAVRVPDLESDRAVVDRRGIAGADVVLVPLEDGDRTEALIKWGKYVIAIDLNPVSRTARMANLTIVDNVVRCVPLITQYVKEMKTYSREKLEKIIRKYNHKTNISESLNLIRRGVK